MKKAVFLDRDGTINKDYGYVHDKNQFELLDGVVEALAIFKELDYMLIIVSNQSGIGRGYFSENQYLEFQAYINDFFEKKGVHIDASYYCPHIEKDKCDCRKPQLGLFYKAAKEWNIDWKESVAIGDRYRDLGICQDKGVKGFLIRGTEEEKKIDNIIIVDSLLQAALMVKECETSSRMQCDNWSGG